MLKLTLRKVVFIGGSVIGVLSFGKWYSNRPKEIIGSPLDHPISRYVKFNNGKSTNNLDLTLFQYQTCPFCCKVRAYLDYNAINYKVVEVNSVTQKQLGWTKYSKVPIAVIKESDKLIQLNDSSVIVSILESYKSNLDKTIQKLQEYYPAFDSVDNRGRKKIDFYNKYEIMSDEESDNPEEMQSEAKWRHWVDDEFVHALAPNIYRTPSEALEAFNYVSQCGDWDRNFGLIQSRVVVYIGAMAMFFIGKILKKRYNLHDDVRKSLFEEANIWVKALMGREFMGGGRPNLADLAVYGVLNSIEGCSAFKELMDKNNAMHLWYVRTKESLHTAYFSDAL